MSVGIKPSLLGQNVIAQLLASLSLTDFYESLSYTVGKFKSQFCFHCNTSGLRPVQSLVPSNIEAQ